MRACVHSLGVANRRLESSRTPKYYIIIIIILLIIIILCLLVIAGRYSRLTTVETDSAYNAPIAPLHSCIRFYSPKKLFLEIATTVVAPARATEIFKHRP